MKIECREVQLVRVCKSEERRDRNDESRREKSEDNLKTSFQRNGRIAVNKSCNCDQSANYGKFE